MGPDNTPKWYDNNDKAIAICVPLDRNNEHLNCIADVSTVVLWGMGLCCITLIIFILVWCILNHRKSNNKIEDNEE